MEKRGSSHQMRRQGARKERKELGKYDKVTSCSAAARLKNIWNTSASRKILEITEGGLEGWVK